MTSAIQLAPATRVLDGPRAVARLAKLGLVPEYLQNAAKAGHRQREKCDALHPKTFPGQVMWAETVRGLRAELAGLGRGWKVGSTANYETVYRLDLGMAIAVVGGDTFTGVRGFRDPTVIRRRGPVTTNRVAKNRTVQLQIDLPGIHEPAESDAECSTWFLLLNARQGSLFLELSLPMNEDAAGRINSFAERIIIPPLELNHASTPIETEEHDVFPEVHVERKP